MPGSLDKRAERKKLVCHFAACLFPRPSIHILRLFSPNLRVLYPAIASRDAMANLCEPPHIHAPPTPSGTNFAKESLNSLETQLQSALAALMQAQRAVERLQQQIQERRAWIAPIRRIPYDVLSLIFVEVCRMDWSAPLIFGQVCHVWRESILGTPRAWSYFRIQKDQSHQVRSLFISRSAPFSLHLCLPSEFDSHTSRLLASVTERIQCVSVGIHQFSALQDHRFAALERLHVRDRHYTMPTDLDAGFILNSDLFPRLRSLSAYMVLDTITWRTPPFPNFVPLQAFSVIANNPEVCSMIVEYCRETLISLSISLCSANVGLNRKVIVLPRLQYLSISNVYPGVPPWFIDARTPALQAYYERSIIEHFVGPIHEDTKTVLYLHFMLNVDLSKFPQVRQIWFCAGWPDNVVGMLMKAPELCPNLETILDDQMGGDSFTRFEELIAARNRQTGGSIQFRNQRFARRDGVFPDWGSIPLGCGDSFHCDGRW